MRPPILAQERLRRSRRDRQSYVRRHLERLARRRFRADLAVIPHVFLARGQVRVARLLGSSKDVQGALRGRATWTLDTAARLACGRGILVQADLTGYAGGDALQDAVARGLIEEPAAARISLDPLLATPRALVVNLCEDPPPFLVLPGGDRVVTWEFLKRDILGTLGWRADILARLDGAYPGSAGSP